VPEVGTGVPKSGLGVSEIATRRAGNRDSPCRKPGLAVPETGTRRAGNRDSA
jgi:hypothetical protein